MLIDTFASNFKKINNVLCVIALIVGAIGGCIGLAGVGGPNGIGVLLGMIGLVVGPLVTYLVLVITLAPFYLFFNVLLKADKKLGE